VNLAELSRNQAVGAGMPCRGFRADGQNWEINSSSLCLASMLR
jgi:hypothetical protein